MTVGQLTALLVMAAGFWLPIGLGAYTFGWWWRGRWERKLEAERIARIRRQYVGEYVIQEGRHES